MDFISISENEWEATTNKRVYEIYKSLKNNKVVYMIETFINDETLPNDLAFLRNECFEVENLSEAKDFIKKNEQCIITENYSLKDNLNHMLNSAGILYETNIAQVNAEYMRKVDEISNIFNIQYYDNSDLNKSENNISDIKYINKDGETLLLVSYDGFATTFGNKQGEILFTVPNPFNIENNFPVNTVIEKTSEILADMIGDPSIIQDANKLKEHIIQILENEEISIEKLQKIFDTLNKVE